MMRGRADVLALALLLDWLLGEPPNALHPVVWLGRLISTLEQHAPHASPQRELVYGTGMLVVSAGIAAMPALVLERQHTSPKRHLIATGGLRLAEAVLLKTTFSWRTLHQAGERVRRPLEQGDLEGARAGLRWLVSRDVTHLDASLVAAAAIESLAENASDSVVAPLVAYTLFGLPGACVYRAVNTLDAMVGYRGQYEYLGKVPARIDDLLNIVPARLTGLLLIASARLCAENARQAWHTLLHDSQRTASPNAGYPMSAIAGALDVRLEKVGHYCLNASGRATTPDDLRRAGRVVLVALALAAGIAWACSSGSHTAPYRGSRADSMFVP